MSKPISRRAFVRASVHGSVAGAAASRLWLRAEGVTTAASAPAAEEGAGLTTYQLGPQIWIRWNNQVLTCYRAHRTQKYPYLYPVRGPVSGWSLTTETALPWPHHRSLFFGCDRVNGGNYWQEEFGTGQILSAGPSLGKVDEESVEILDACEWRKPGEPAVMKDERRIKVRVVSPRLYFIDFEIRWGAVADVTVQKTNHSLFALRAAHDLTPPGGGELLNAEGLAGEQAIFGKTSAWCDFHGRRGSPPGEWVEGIAILDHPANPWSPSPWFTRDYGFISPTPFNFKDPPWKLAAGSSVTLRYRVVAHAGTPADAKLAGIYKSWNQ